MPNLSELQNHYNLSTAFNIGTTNLDSIISIFNTSKVVIVLVTVPDSPNTIFIGGLPHNRIQSLVLKLLAVFVKVKAFHMIKANSNSLTSKSYHFV